MATIEFLGHSGLRIDHQGVTLLCDPWLSPHGAYNASWFQYPEYPRKRLDSLLRPTAVYVSHEHPDHYDPWFLAQLPRDTLVLTGRFHKKRCARKLRQLRFERVVELDDFEAQEIAPGFAVRIAVPAYNCAPHWFDSCALIEAGGHKIFNLNDANFNLPAERLREQGIDVLLGQASPAIWYPLTYTQYGAEEHRNLKAQRRQSAIDSFVAAVRAVGPRLAIPFAGPPCFFDPQLADLFLEPDSMFPTPPLAAAAVRAAAGIPAAVLKPGDRLLLDEDAVCDAGSARVETLDTGYRIAREPSYEDFDYERDRRSYYERRRDEKREIVDQVLAAVAPAPGDLFQRFARHFAPLIRNNPFFRARIDMRVLFDLSGPNGGKWVVDFRDQAAEEPVYPWRGDACEYEIATEARFVAQVLAGTYSWEDLLLSFRFRARRNPDRYNQHLFTFLKMGDHAALQEIAKAEMAMATEPEDTFELRANGCRYRVQRFCPHAGSDLSDGEVVDGMLVCPGHRWHFDLATGACRESDYRIYCERIDDAGAEAEAHRGASHEE